MWAKSNSLSHSLTCGLSSILVLFTVFTAFANGRTQQNQPEKPAYEDDSANVPDAIAKVKSGEFFGTHVNLIVKAHAVEAIPPLEEQFPRVEDQILKEKVASALVRLGDKDDTYWNFLVRLATRAVESDAPNFTSHNAQGKSLPGPSPEFQAWVRAHNLSPAEAQEQLDLLPAAVGFLALTGDSRAVPLLRQALLSPNYMTETWAAWGLADLQDKKSIPLIIQACKRAPQDAAAVIARALVYFDTPEAQSAVDEYIPKDAAKIYRDAKANGKKRPWSD